MTQAHLRNLRHLDAEQLLDQFERAWLSGASPEIRNFLPPALPGGSAGNDPASRALLEELVKLDLEYRWRHAVQVSSRQPAAHQGQPDVQPVGGVQRACPRLEDYVARYPELGRLDQLSLELIGAEYLVRQCWGDQPGHEEFVARFTQQVGKLRETLARIDVKVVAEFRRAREAVPASAPPRASMAASDQVSKPSPACPKPILPTAAGALVDTLRQGGFLNPDQLDELVRSLQARFPQPRALAKQLLERGWLTPFQVNQLLLGRAADLLLGPYVLLERLGEGGAGQVFKARHQRMNRVVALKVIRKELLADADVVGRFYREIQVVSQLDHPNVVHAYDAGPVGATHFLAMEYIEGTDLGRLVKQSGPLPVLQACEYIRQAATGLQHAHERGLVHRDIKPHNLIMSVRDGLAKVADLGLARLQQSMNLEVTAALTGMKATGTLTPVNAIMMGTVDYMAPEQALDFHTADIRADIYSLGCTFYYLLTGQPPFPGGTLTQKLLKHQQAEPSPIDRRDMPSGLALVLGKMLAKRPEGRYQTPAAVAATLEFLSHPPRSAAKVSAALASSDRALVVSPAKKHPLPKPSPIFSSQRRRILVLGSAVVIPVLVGAYFLFRPMAPTEVLESVIAKGITPESWQTLLDLRQPNPGSTIAQKATELLRQDLLDHRLRHPGTPDASQAAVLLMQLPSPLDQMKPVKNSEDLPKGPKLPALVAVLGKPVALRGAHGVAFNRDGTQLLQASGRQLRRWDLSEAEPKELIKLADSIEAGIAAVFSLDGLTLASCSGNSALDVELWDLTQAPPKKRPGLRVGPHPVQKMALAPDSQTLAVTVSGGGMHVWDLKAMTKKPATTDRSGPLAFAPDGRKLASIGYDGNLRLWDNLDEAKPKLEFKPHKTGAEAAIAFHPQGAMLASVGGDDCVVLWNPWNPSATLPQVDSYPLQGGKGAVALAFSPDGKMLVCATSGSDNQVICWDVHGGRVRYQWNAPSPVRGMVFAPDGRHLAIAHGDGTVYILRLFEPVKI